MPSPEAEQVHIATAYMYDRNVAEKYVKTAMRSREAADYPDCSACPERIIFDHLWSKKPMRDSLEGANAFHGNWGLISSGTAHWQDILHVDVWSKAQYVKRQGVNVELQLTAMIQKDRSRFIWPIAFTALNIRMRDPPMP